MHNMINFNFNGILRYLFSSFKISVSFKIPGCETYINILYIILIFLRIEPIKNLKHADI